MAFTVSSAKLTSTPGATGWVQVHEFEPTEEEKVKTRGHLFAVVATKRYEKEIDSVSAGRELLTRLHEEYFGKVEGGAYEALKQAVEKVVNEFSTSWGDVEIAAISIVNDVCYSVVCGGGRVFIFRNGILANILVSQGKDTPVKVISASGYPQDGDILVLGTGSFFDSLPQGIIKAALEMGNLNEAVESLAPTIHSQDPTGTYGAVIVKFGLGKTVAPEEDKIPEQRIDKTFVVRKKVENVALDLKRSLSLFVSRFLPERKIYVHEEGYGGIEPSGNRRTTLTLGVILLILLIVSIGFGIRTKMVKDQRSRYEVRLTQAKHDLDEASNLIGLNPTRSRELFVESQNIISDLLKQGIKDPEINSLGQKIGELRGALLGEYRLDSQLFVDLSLQTSGFVGQNISSSGDKVFILDKTGKRIIGVSLDTKKTEVVAGPDQVDDPVALASYEDRVFILNSSGVYEVGETKVKVIDKDWTGEIIPYAYASNMYLVDKATNSIWRYQGAGSKFGTKERWLAAGVNPNLSNIVHIAIDGSIWCLKSSGEIIRFSLGSPQNFSVSGVVPDLTNADSIYTNEDLKYLYILDKTGKRVVVIDKNGEYKAQYISDKIGEATDLVVSEKEKKIILLSGSKLYSIELKHLD